MPDPSQLDLLTERVERLLLRYEELTRTNALLYRQIDSLTQERDSLKSRLSAARARWMCCLSGCQRCRATLRQAPTRRRTHETA
jgi:cell division protein ZapB